MRLTLRTLLAYLDNTLEPQDAEILRNKLTESGFATQLVQRIRSNLVDASLTAPPPEAVGPIDDANVIGEYLDSTLPAEQVAEIERACLESDTRLAEAAACHQILTMALGNSAAVPRQLRERIYALPDREVDKIAAASTRLSSLAIDDPPVSMALTNELPTADAAATQLSQPVKPVGLGDSGVSDAPTRIRESAAADEGDAAPSPKTAASRARSVDEASIYGGTIGPSRMAPWLISFALAAVLLFALVQIFRPLLKQSTAMIDSEDEIASEMEVSNEEAPSMMDAEPETFSSADRVADPIAEADLLPATEMLSPPAAVSATAQTQSLPDIDPIAPPTAEAMPASELPPATSNQPVGNLPGGEAPDGQAPDGQAPDGQAPGGQAPDEIIPATEAVPTTSTSEIENRVTPGPEKTDGEPAAPPASDQIVQPSLIKEFATITSDQTLLAALPKGEQWVRLNKDMTVLSGIQIFCAPTFRGQMTSAAGVNVTLIGPAQVQWNVNAEQIPTLVVEFGRILVSANKAATNLNVQLGSQLLQLGFSDVDSVAAASIKHFRVPGVDPVRQEKRIELAGVLSVQGALKVSSNGEAAQLTTGQQWVKRGETAANVSPVEVVPDWIDPPDPSESTLEASARNGLLELLSDNQPLEISLREATLFRRSEVAAIAARTLIHLGLADVYFGGDGILSEPKQRAYWPEHFLDLLTTLDRSAASASRLVESINKMDLANAKQIFRLLAGYSPKQLTEGGDEELVQMLDSDSMTVRVLALENLHRITGTTLYFRAEQENAIRRAPGIKKWVARQRKGDIRWQE